MEVRPSQKIATAPAAAPARASQKMPAAQPSPPAPSPPEAGPQPAGTDLRSELEGRPLARFAVGVALALLAGLAAAWLFASVREGSAYDAPRAEIRRAQEDYVAARPSSAEELQALNTSLDRVRADQGALLEDARSGIALFAGLIWLGVAGAVGLVWVRRVGW